MAIKGSIIAFVKLHVATTSEENHLEKSYMFRGRECLQHVFQEEKEWVMTGMSENKMEESRLPVTS